MRPHLVVVGGVAAGPKIAAKARREDPDLAITLVTDEAMISYAGCGTPYFLGRTFKERDKLLVRTADSFAEANGVTVLTEHRALSIDRAARTVTVRDLRSGTEQVLEYTKLALCTGASPIVPPLEGLPARGVFALRTVSDAYAIDDWLNSHNGRRVVIVGAGYIGLELAEQFRDRQLEVTIVELAPQVLPRFDLVTARAVERELSRLGCQLLLGTRVTGVETDHRGEVTGVRTSAGTLGADLVMMSIGVRPNVELARAAGLEIGQTGAIATNPAMQTSDPDIYAAGDCAECLDRVSGQPTWIPLGSTANKMGRTAAINLTGGKDSFPGVVGTSLVRVGEVNVGVTGLGESQLQKLGVRYESVAVPSGDKPGYMPGAAEITLVLHAEVETRRLLGAQCFGPGEVDKRTDVLATAVTARMTVDDVAQLDLGYAPPFAPAMDVVITAANVLRNKLDGSTASVMPAALAEERAAGRGHQLVDVRELDEWNDGHIAGAQHMPLGQVRERGGELQAGADTVVYCRRGARSATAYRQLRQLGLKQLRYLEGGTTAWTEDLEG